MMCKNEDELLPIWGRYHGHLLGFENLYVFDNGSTTAASLTALDDLHAAGVHVDRSFGRVEDYPSKGQITAGEIRRLDRERPADFYFPLDCDEFLAVEDGPYALDCTRAGLERELAPHAGFSGVLTICAGYDNSPETPGLYVRSPEQRKAFFAQGACTDLDHGSHVGFARTEARASTKVVYLHHHYKPFEHLVRHAREKLTPFVDDLSPQTYETHRRNGVPGHHLISHLELADEAAYLAAYRHREYRPIVSFTRALETLGARTPYAAA
jgi:hypothetical protein